MVVLAAAAALVAQVVEAKATTTEARMALAEAQVLVVLLAVLTLAQVGQAAQAALVETVVAMVLLAATAHQALLATQAQMATTLTALLAQVALAVRQAGQPVSISVAYLTSHSRTMAQCKEARPDAVHYP